MHIWEGYDYFRLYIGKCDLHVGLIMGIQWVAWMCFHMWRYHKFSQLNYDKIKEKTTMCEVESVVYLTLVRYHIGQITNYVSLQNN